MTRFSRQNVFDLSDCTFSLDPSDTRFGDNIKSARHGPCNVKGSKSQGSGRSPTVKAKGNLVGTEKAKLFSNFLLETITEFGNLNERKKWPPEILVAATIIKKSSESSGFHFILHGSGMSSSIIDARVTNEKLKLVEKGVKAFLDYKKQFDDF